MGLIQNGRLYLNVWEQLCDNHNKVSQNTIDEKACVIILLKMPQEFCYPSQKLRKQPENFDSVILLLYHV